MGTLRIEQNNSNKRIVKNTVYLYCRSLLMVFINLYASRIILQVLGVDDYGLYGVIGSLVSVFTIINGSLSSGSSRFLTFELGKGNFARLKKTFNASFAMHCALAIVFLLIMETVGLWFINHKMNIPIGRELAANVVYQTTVASCVLSLTQIPYSAIIIAYEKMNIYAYVGLCEAIFKLALVYILLHVPFTDNLIAYAIITSIWSIGLQIYYRIYCYRKFKETHLALCKDKNIYKRMLSYSVWDTIGAFCVTGNTHGVNILINMFFSVSMNASRSIAYQVEMGVSLLSNNFMTAVNPQIVKSYAQGNSNRFFELIFYSGKFAYYLLFVIILPLCLEIDYILSLWLVEVPPLSSLFVRFALIITLLRIMVRPAINGVHATGNVKILNLTSGVVSAVSFIPLVYIAFKIGLPIWTCYIIEAILYCIICTYLEIRALYLNIPFDRMNYFRRVIMRSVLISLVPTVFTMIIYHLMSPGLIRFICMFLICLSSLSFFIYFLDLSKEMRKKILSVITKRIQSFI